ncbi:MAG: hypothetical protein WBE01_06505 [Methyloceanibacter sp.]
MNKTTLIAFAALALVRSAPLASPLSAEGRSAQIVQQLKAKSAIFVPMSKLPKGLATKPKSERYTCDSVACWCSGGSDCLDLIDAKGAQCTHFVCGNDHGTPVCWCDL